MSGFESSNENDVVNTNIATPTPDADRDGVRDGEDASLHQARRTQKQPNFWRAVLRDPMLAVMLGLLLAAVFGALGAVASLGGTTTYTSTTVMLIDDPFALATAGDQSTFVKLDALRVKYSGLVSTYAIAQPVANKLRLPVGAVLASASTQVPFESLLMDVSATWNTPREAQIISQAIADQVTSYVRSEDTTFGIPQADRFTFNTIDPASPAIAQTPSKSKAVAIAIGLAITGFILGFLATQIVRYLR